MGQLLYVIFDLVAHVLMISPSVFSPYAQTYYNRTNLILQFDPYQPGGNAIDLIFDNLYVPLCSPVKAEIHTDS